MTRNEMVRADGTLRYFPIEDWFSRCLIHVDGEDEPAWTFFACAEYYFRREWPTDLRPDRMAFFVAHVPYLDELRRRALAGEFYEGEDGVWHWTGEEFAEPGR